MHQSQLAELFDTSKQNIGQHIACILEDNELGENSVVKNYFTTAADGKDYNYTIYSLKMILAIGFRVGSKRSTKLRQMANHNLTSYMIKNFVMDDERLIILYGRPDYFDLHLARIRDVRASENDFTKKYLIYLNLVATMTIPIKQQKCFMPKRKIKFFFNNGQNGCRNCSEPCRCQRTPIRHSLVGKVK
jgi:hypothetical protein